MVIDMGNLTFPSELTEEELALKAKYAMLRKKKKHLNAVRCQVKPDQVKCVSNKSNKQIVGAKDAKEVAKKLLRSGTLSAIQKKSGQQVKSTKFEGFKKSKGYERKLTQQESGVSLSGYQPFAVTHGHGGGFDTGGEDMVVETPAPLPGVQTFNKLMRTRDLEERGLIDMEDGKERSKNNVHVSGHHITKALVEKAFSSCGKIIRTYIEPGKDSGFVTFLNPDSAENAISQFNKAVVDGVELKVSMARRQPSINPINNASSSASWSNYASDMNSKGDLADTRQLLEFEDSNFFN